jgi:hypothetical protein
MLNSIQVNAKLAELLAAPGESECVEFKEAKTSFEIDKLGKYFAALCNEANLKGADSSWLIFGITNDRRVCGSKYRPNRDISDSSCSAWDPDLLGGALVWQKWRIFGAPQLRGTGSNTSSGQR